jgi:hypothetical protein
MLPVILLLISDPTKRRPITSEISTICGVTAALWPVPDANRWIVCGNITDHGGHLVGEAAACGWLERLKGRYLMPSPSRFYCRTARKLIVAGLVVARV